MVICADKIHRNILLEYLAREPELNLQMISCLERGKWNDNNHNLWFGQNDHIHWSILRCYHSLFLQSYHDEIPKQFILELVQKFEIDTVYGKTAVLDLYGWKNFPVEKRCRFASLHGKVSAKINDVVYLKEDDAGEIADLLDRCFENGNDSARIRHEIEKHEASYFGIIRNSRIVGVSAVTSESRNYGMVISICVDPSWRRHGFGYELTAAASNDLLQRRKIPCLYYDSAAAAAVYRKAGYQNIGNWSIRTK